MSVRVIIGKNFGDEGKGLATDFFAARSRSAGRSCLVIRHNGGGQAGHTVDLPDKRFVFHQLSSGSFRGADTFWAEHFLPDLYKLYDEAADFAALGLPLPALYGHPACRCVCIDDVLVNMALETSRGKNRHGSCGMGINEAVVRSSNPDFTITLEQACTLSAEGLYRRLSRLRREYLPVRLAELGLTLSGIGEYGELLSNENVLINAAEQMHQASRLVTLADGALAARCDDVIFEGAQGLLLDECCASFAPHLTSSRTGSHNPAAFLREHLPGAVPEIVYVTRSYVTRHGAGPLPHEAAWGGTDRLVPDQTNVRNPWQGQLRYAPHGSPEEFIAPIREDLAACPAEWSVSCMLTHLNETAGSICSTGGSIPAGQWFRFPAIRSHIHRVYLSASPFSGEIRGPFPPEGLP